MYKKADFLRMTFLSAALAAAFPAWPQAADANAMSTLDPVVITGVARLSPSVRKKRTIWKRYIAHTL